VATVLDARQNLARIQLNSQDPPRLEPVTDGFTGDLDPAWSPDRSRLVFSSSRSGVQNLWSMRQNLTAPVPLTVGTAMDTRPSFSRDGQQIAFISDRGGHLGIWAMATDNGTPRLVTPAVLLDGVSWSPDGGRLVAAVPGASQPRLITIRVNDGKIEPLPTPSSASAPSWSPVEDLIAYLEPRGAGLGTRLRFVTGDGRTRPDLVSPGEPALFGNGLLSWAADGKRLAVVGLPGTSTGSVWVATVGVPVSWKKVTDLPAGVHLRGVTWSADGSELIVGVVRWSGDIILAER
jgi:Tol biopolymer transport system component